ncbi:MAG: hypothetical protein JWO05_2409 [Gemmatimonadetes bacterium]|nr:hypothetical protein [Gemmatimonadota bacterium]
MRTRRLLAFVASASLVLAPFRDASGQRAQRADSLVRAGALDLGEWMLYQAVSARPRDGAARAALGRYLLGRGAPRVAAVLFEEAVRFGAQPLSVVDDLAQAYEWSGDFAPLAALASSPLDTAERMRAWYLAPRTAVTWLSDERATLGLSPTVEVGSLFEVKIVLGGRTITAVVDPRERGLTLDASLASDAAVRSFPRSKKEPAAVGVASVVGVGEATLRDVPVRFALLRDAGRALIGLDVLWRLAPSVDVAAGTLLLRRSGDARGVIGRRYPLLWANGSVHVLLQGRWTPLAGELAAPLRARRWTLDPRLGELIVE